MPKVKALLSPKQQAVFFANAEVSSVSLEVRPGMMLVVVSHDVSTQTAAGRRRLRRVSKACLDFGQRVQNYVFECRVDPEQLARLKHRLLAEFSEEEDSLRFYLLGANWRGHVEHFGTKPSVD